MSARSRPMGPCRRRWPTRPARPGRHTRLAGSLCRSAVAHRMWLNLRPSMRIPLATTSGACTCATRSCLPAPSAQRPFRPRSKLSLPTVLSLVFFCSFAPPPSLLYYYCHEPHLLFLENKILHVRKLVASLNHTLPWQYYTASRPRGLDPSAWQRACLQYLLCAVSA
ncbi:hypothetical protein GQ54DRAFT_218315 [Martensiomyces pterosporus]|nr:hypothetical protein GQ54DRAFT_218315 [Martensiomyces pterosporus]